MDKFAKFFGYARVPAPVNSPVIPPRVGEEAGMSTEVILQAFQSSRVALESKIGEVSADVVLLWQDLHNTTSLVTVAKICISEMEDMVKTLQQMVQLL